MLYALNREDSMGHRGYFVQITLMLVFQSMILGSCTQWIVVTTINYPTEQLKRLAQLHDWKIVVVGDIKTPSDWYLPGCEFLDYDTQLKLGYKITKFLPCNHYCRKNIGYLYAIAHGAQVIYDTDDDNLITGPTIKYYPEKSVMNVGCSKNQTINPYAYFGQETVWPRGFPLQAVHQKNDFNILQKQIRPLIQQGLVNNDPDVDAIFRLTRNLPISFLEKEPLALANGVMAPFNSQNTIFHYQAFWGLIIPAFTPFRVCDIWRGYLVQRLLWDIGGSLCFTGPSAIQLRNAHDYYQDFLSEIDLYTKSGALVQLLINWSSTAPSLFCRIIDLCDQLIDKNFFDAHERDLINAWIEDLKNCGYQDILIEEK